jgi:hypothetical protein
MEVIMNVKKLLLVTLAALAATAGTIQAKRHHRHHGPRMSFGFSVGTPMVAAPVAYPVSYAQPCCACQPAYYYAPVRVRPHVGFSFGSGPVGFGFSI